MPRVTIRCSTAQKSRSQLIAQVSEKASDLLQRSDSDRVLVVYQGQKATLHYEGPPQAKVRPT